MTVEYSHFILTDETQRQKEVRRVPSFRDIGLDRSKFKELLPEGFNSRGDMVAVDAAERPRRDIAPQGFQGSALPHDGAQTESRSAMEINLAI
jgi:hypothetical protein